MRASKCEIGSEIFEIPFLRVPPIHYLEFPWSILYYPLWHLEWRPTLFLQLCASIESDNYIGAVTGCGSNDDYTNKNFHVVATAPVQPIVVPRSISHKIASKGDNPSNKRTCAKLTLRTPFIWIESIDFPVLIDATCTWIRIRFAHRPIHPWFNWDAHLHSYVFEVWITV